MRIVIKKSKKKKEKTREKIFPGIFGRLVSRVRAVKRKFSNCQHTSSDGPSGTKFNFPTMTTAQPSLGIATARLPFCRRASRSRARARIIEYDDIRRRNTLCPRKFLNVNREERDRSLFLTKFHHDTRRIHARIHTRDTSNRA